MNCTQKKHFVCKFNGCNNRCDGKHDTNECSDHAHYYDPPVWHVDEVKCEKCGVPRFSNMLSNTDRMARGLLVVVLLTMIVVAQIYEVSADSCGCPTNSDKCEQNCIKKYYGTRIVKGACGGFLFLYCKCSVDGGGWYSIAGIC
ncbi:unnamed protein product [Adineta steineri]|uniref:Uncharacterized protein n=1 Tax=Adineta steineri TaxID=433720 RepID=A0A820AG86_9BILA|nr:unnamed protein product [Adineta steineri]